ncbi:MULTISPECIES: hypothetical protein [Streptomyces]|uniref:Uncharacterized protein n=1 Tax=Streptomyces eurythermus TaxID=42237 RepID=A0ABW6YVJ8_9ACTN|nr:MULTISPECIES: hypothetical protein [Streptomyces]QIS71665.1 hypothetical protein HB370_18040 [Streptomyces sp. DSM 40868]WDM17069.1 hypothetical protein J3S85_39920 [Streptomyces lavenduligriseus]
MTQSGQGEEPSARPAREGIVLPSDGGEPLLPGTTAPPEPAAPAGGQSWDGSWGPGQQTPPPGQGWPPAAAQQWTGPGQQPPSAAGPGPLPPEGAPAPSYGGQAPGYGDSQAAGPGAYGTPPQPGYGAPDPYQQPYQGQQSQQPYPGQQPQQPYQPQQNQQPYPGQPYPASPAAPMPSAAGAPLPPPADAATQYLPPVTARGGADEGATQYIPPVQAAPADGATQYIPPVAAGPAGPGDEAATQYIPPVASGALPPESGAEETRYLGRTPRQPGPAPADAEATQYIPPYAAETQIQAPVPAADRQPPAEFDNLFRGSPAGDDGPAGSTQQLPAVQRPDAYPGPEPSAYRPAQPSYDHGPDDGGGRRGGRSRVPLIAAAAVGLIVVGVGAGALLSAGGGDGKDAGGDDTPVVAASPAGTDSASASPSADPARQQAVELDKLLADSGSSRAAVIQAVADVRKCDNLDQAAADLRDAARQRGELVTRLNKLPTDKLHSQGHLRDALTRAWQASAAADNHYAAWADQVKGRKGCHKGQARSTGETQAGNRESKTATEQKGKAAPLWNAIARQYGLTQRQPTQL